ncbi:hypothetical protein, partial [Rudaea sp.]|uniref:hypothetical protein n=1 Tax=Rudaea sp. TaxID=2136325 RepID=UPI002ED01075
NEPRHDLANPERAARRARHPGCISFGYFSLGKQRKVTRSRDASGKANGRDHIKIKNKARSKWIPAFTGMTSQAEQELDSRLRGNDEQRKNERSAR